MSNNTNATADLKLDVLINTIFDGILILEVVAALVLNSLVIYIVWKHLWTPSNQLIFFLAITDACVVLVLPSSIASIYFRRNQAV